MPLLIWFILLGTLNTCFAQTNPCHCLRMGICFHDRMHELSFIPVNTHTQKDGSIVQVYQEENLKTLTAIAVLHPPSPQSSPKVQELYWKKATNQEIVFHIAWDFDLSKAHKNEAAFAKKHKKERSKLHLFDFLPPMNSVLQAQIYLVYNEDYKKHQWPLPNDKIQMKVNLSIPAHPFYSDWNARSPFKMTMPRLKEKLAYIKGYQWDVRTEDGVRIIKELSPLQK